jgi:hypothetical protein
MFLSSPTKPPTPSEYAVIVITIAGLLIAFGAVALALAFRAGPEKHEMAIALEHRGFWSLELGVGIAGLFWLFRRLSQ